MYQQYEMNNEQIYDPYPSHVIGAPMTIIIFFGMWLKILIGICDFNLARWLDHDDGLDMS